ncbi:protein SMAX1-LIKE 6 [Impatiens glandulifera]|uniref:protein SMAX1-LIKE 6 n=1 Tax=Impatiens glandulifera TaxID=253017 RepID=UPI001FB14E77|nr:protein SMAX1-LIKE 6 [Impatiens glandulifera]
MPTPVSTARQCLTDEAARALDEAVSVAHRRSHAQTTSLHAVSALLSLPSSFIRDACARARSCAYSPRLQFRALELCVSVSLDRIPVTKAVADEPPVSNSLMAAIKRSQANQRRHPDTFYLYQQLQQFNNCNQSSLSCVKVELKHFILSILDDPIVSRVFGDAGFRSCDLKFAILQPPPISRFARSRLPPLFLCNLPDSELDRSAFTFPYAGLEIQDENNNRRIVEILTKKTNPLLIGACAKDALVSFTESLRTEKPGTLPAELDGLRLISLEREISEICEAKLEVKLKEIGDSVEQCSGPGTLINLGDFKRLIVEDGHGASSSSIDAVKLLVSRLTGLLKNHGRKKLWVIGAVESYENYKMFLAQFPWVEGDWDLQTLPITSSKPSPYPKSRLIGSFVPLGGFFSGPTEFENLQSGSGAHGFTLCELCNQKYEQESEQTIGVQSKDDHVILKAKLVGLKQKWNDICQRLHPIPRFNHGPAESSRFVAKTKENQSTSSNEPSVVRVPENAESLGQRRPSTDLGLGCFSNEQHEGQTKNFKSICKFLSERVSWQDDAICQISQAISNFRSGNRSNSQGRRRHRGDLWLSFLGPDQVGKKKVASALAEVIYGSIESLIYVDLSREDWAGSNIRRGKTVIDYICDKLSLKPHSVVLLENIDKADFVAQTSLSRAITTGKFADSHGREIGLNDTIFVTTSGSSEYTEEQIAKRKRKQIDVNIDSSEQDRLGKKKKHDTRSFLDLNLPADSLEEEEEKSDSENSNNGSDSWVESFLIEVDEKVVFRPRTS